MAGRCLRSLTGSTAIPRSHQILGWMHTLDFSDVLAQLDLRNLEFMPFTRDFIYGTVD